MKLAETEIQFEPTVSLTENENFEENRNRKSFFIFRINQNTMSCGTFLNDPKKKR